MSNHQRRTFTPEFRQMAIDLALQGHHSIGQIERDLGLSDGLLRQWLKKHRRATSAGTTVAVLHAETRELARLRRENLRLQQEHTVLKKAVALFAHPSPSGTASSRSTDE